jgi:hypothetical protein
MGKMARRRTPLFTISELSRRRSSWKGEQTDDRAGKVSHQLADSTLLDGRDTAEQHEHRSRTPLGTQYPPVRVM